MPTKARYIKIICSQCGRHICFAHTRPDVALEDCISNMTLSSVNDGKHYTPYIIYCEECEDSRLEDYNHGDETE